MATDMKKSTHPAAAEVLDKAVMAWPDLPGRSLARMLYKEHKTMWPSIEVCRKAIGYRRGRGGKQSRSYKTGAANSAVCTAPSVPWNPEAFVPPSEDESFLPHVVQVERDTRALVLSDLHVPFHSVPAIRAALEAGRKSESGIVILNGDVLDMYRLSRFMKDPTSRDMEHEVTLANQLLDGIDELFPAAKKIFKLGNHDERYEHYVMAHAPEIYKLVKEKCSLAALLELEERGWEYVTDRRPIYLGKLPIIHGHEYPTPVMGPVNAARGLFLRAKNVALTGHHHQTSEHTETTIKGEMITTWSTGCLCGLHPMYARFNKWNHGFAQVEVARNGNFQVHNRRIHAGKVLN